MPEAVTVRPETPADHAAVRTLVAAAFGQPDEADLVDASRVAGDAAVALVATRDDAAVGHVLLSRMIAPFRALGLAPLAVAPDRQGEGIGAVLVRAAIAAARDAGWQGIFVLGDPAYYGRFGFSAAAAQAFGSPYAGPHFQLLPLIDPPLPPGPVSYAAAFAAL